MNSRSWFEDKNILVTGGLGFIGSNLTHRLVELGANVTVLDALIPGLGGNLDSISDIHTRIRLETVDMRDNLVLENIVKGKDTIYHLAGSGAHKLSMDDPYLDHSLNVVSSLNLLESCRRMGVRCPILYSSTRQVYGIPDHLPVDESHPIRPVDINGVHKLAAENYHRLYNEKFGIPSIILRLSNVYGPRMQMQNELHGFITVFFQRWLASQELEIYGTGEQLRDLCYIDDIVSAMILSVENEGCHGKIFNIGSGVPNTINEIVKTMNSIYPVLSRNIKFPSEKKVIDIGNYYSNTTAFSSITDWKPLTDIQRGIGLTYTFLRNKQISESANEQL